MCWSPKEPNVRLRLPETTNTDHNRIRKAVRLISIVIPSYYLALRIVAELFQNADLWRNKRFAFILLDFGEQKLANPDF